MSLDPADRGLLLGDGLFETLLWSDGVLRDFEAHAARMARGCAVIGLPAPAPAALAASAEAAVARAGLAAGRAAVRLTWTAGSGGRGLDRPEPVSPMLLANAHAAPVPAAPASLVTTGVRRNDRSPTARIKSLAYLDNVLARREARAAGADEALMLNTKGEIACAAAANLFWFEGEALLTPSLECGVLAGVTRAAVIAAATGLGLVAVEVRAGRERLTRAGGVFLTNSLVGVREVARLDGVAVGLDARVARLARAIG